MGASLETSLPPQSTGTSIPPPNLLEPVPPPLVLLDPEPVSVPCSVPSSSATPETHPSSNSFSHTPFSVCFVRSYGPLLFDGCFPYPLRPLNVSSPTTFGYAENFLKNKKNIRIK